MEKAISTLTILPTTKVQINDYTNQIKRSILSGEYDLLNIAKVLKSLGTIAETLLKDEEIKEAIHDEADKWHEKTFEHVNCKFQKRETAKYDFSICEDSELTMLENEEKRIKAAIKARKEYLKTLKDFAVNQETGEVIKPATKTITSSLVITLK